RESEITVVMNPETAAEDVAAVGPGGAIVLNDQIQVPEIPADRFVYRVPMKALIEPITTDVKLRRLVINMIYVGVLAELLPLVELGGVLDRLPRAHASRPLHRQADLRRDPSRGRNRRDRHGARGELGRGARHDLDLRAGAVADGGIRRLRLLRRNPRGDLGH